MSRDGADHPHALSAVIAHARQNHADRHWSGILRCAFKRQVRARTITADAWAIIKRNSAGRRNPQVMRAGTNIKLPRNNNLAGFRFFHLDARYLRELRTELGGKVSWHMLH